MYYVEVDETHEDWVYWEKERDSYTSQRIPTTKLIGPFKYRKDVEEFLLDNEAKRIIQID